MIVFTFDPWTGFVVERHIYTMQRTENDFTRSAKIKNRFSYLNAFELYLLVRKVLHSMNGNGFHDLDHRRPMLNLMGDDIRRNWSNVYATWSLWPVAVQQQIRRHHNGDSLDRLVLWLMLCPQRKMVWIAKFDPLYKIKCDQVSLFQSKTKYKTNISKGCSTTYVKPSVCKNPDPQAKP